MPIRIYEDYPPIRMVVFDGQSTDVEFRGYIDAMTRWISEGGTPGILLDASTSAIMPKNQRTMQASWMKEHHARLTELDSPTAFVITNPAIRFVLSTIFLVAPMAGKHQVVGSRQQALDFLRRILSARNVSVPAGVDALVDVA